MSDEPIPCELCGSLAKRSNHFWTCSRGNAESYKKHKYQIIAVSVAEWNALQIAIQNAKLESKKEGFKKAQELQKQSPHLLTSFEEAEREIE